MGFKNYAQNIINKLEEEGYAIEEYEDKIDEELTPTDEIEESIKSIRDRDYAQYRQEIVEAENPNDLEFQKLKKQRAKTKEERLKLAKGELTRRYLSEDITDDLILKDDDGWYPQIQLHYYLTIGREHLESRDRAKLQALDPKGNPFKPMLIDPPCLSKSKPRISQYQSVFRRG